MIAPKNLATTGVMGGFWSSVTENCIDSSIEKLCLWHRTMSTYRWWWRCTGTSTILLVTVAFYNNISDQSNQKSSHRNCATLSFLWRTNHTCKETVQESSLVCWMTGEKIEDIGLPFAHQTSNFNKLKICQTTVQNTYTATTVLSLTHQLISKLYSSLCLPPQTQDPAPARK